MDNITVRYNVGDKVVIVSDRTNPTYSWHEDMDEYLGTIMTINNVFSVYKMLEDKGRWGWSNEMINHEDTERLNTFKVRASHDSDIVFSISLDDIMDRRVALLCKSEVGAIRLLRKLKDLGITWHGGKEIKDGENYWYNYNKYTCYIVEGETRTLGYADLEHVNDTERCVYEYIPKFEDGVESMEDYSISLSATSSFKGISEIPHDGLDTSISTYKIWELDSSKKYREITDSFNNGILHHFIDGDLFYTSIAEDEGAKEPTSLQKMFSWEFIEYDDNVFPLLGDEYHTICIDFDNSINTSTWNNDEWDRQALKNNNVFRTKREAKAMLNKVENVLNGEF